MLRLFVLAAAAGLGPVALANAAPQQPPLLALLLHDPSRQPIVGATGHMQCDPVSELPALRGFPFATPSPITATSDHRGILRFLPTDTPRAGSVFVTTTRHAGAVVPRLLPGDAQRIVLQPMAEITTADASEPLTVWAALRTPEGQRITLPPLHGPRVRLPAGSYEVWAKSPVGWLWQRFDLVSGQSHSLRFEGPAQRVRAAENATVHPSGWPGIELLGPDTPECVLIGGAIAAPLVARVPATGRIVAEAVLPGPTSPEPIGWPPPDLATASMRVPLANAPAGTSVFSLRATEGESWRLLATKTVGADGACELPRPTGGDDWVLALANDHAPAALPWSEIAAGKKIEMVRGVPLVVSCTNANGEPAIDVVVDYVPGSGDVARTVARSDGRGRARFAALQAPGVLRISDARFGNQEIALATIPLDGVAMVLATGEPLAGRVVASDGKPLEGTVVTLRDPSGRLRPAARAVTSGPDGAFAFAGLTADRDFVLFATTTHDGRTWSGRLSRARVGGEAVEITVRSEDPELGPANPRR